MAGRRSCGAAVHLVDGRVEGGYTDVFEHLPRLR
jgi:hypothetical protein